MLKCVRAVLEVSWVFLLVECSLAATFCAVVSTQLLGVRVRLLGVMSSSYTSFFKEVSGNEMDLFTLWPEWLAGSKGHRPFSAFYQPFTI